MFHVHGAVRDIFQHVKVIFLRNFHNVGCFVSAVGNPPQGIRDGDTVHEKVDIMETGREGINPNRPVSCLVFGHGDGNAAE